MNNEELTIYLETHYEVVSALEQAKSLSFDSNNNLIRYYDNHGMGGMWELAKSITDDFETLYRGKEWDGEWLETLEDYIHLRINQL